MVRWRYYSIYDDTQEKRDYIENNPDEVNSATLDAWNSGIRTVHSFVLFWNKSRQIIWDTRGTYSALTSAKYSTQKTAIYGAHSADATVEVYVPYLSVHTEDSQGNPITDYEPYKFAIYNGVEASVNNGAIKYIDYTPTQWFYVTSQEKQTDTQVTYTGYDVIEYSSFQFSWDDVLKYNNRDTINLIAVLDMIGRSYDQTGRDYAHIVSSDLAYQNWNVDKINLSSDKSTNIRMAIDKWSEAIGTSVSVYGEHSDSFEVNDDSHWDEIYTTRPVYNASTIVTIPSNSIYEVNDVSFSCKRINSLSVTSVLGNDASKTIEDELLPVIGEEYETCTYTINDNPFINLLPYNRLPEETTTDVPITVEELVDRLLNVSSRSLSETLYYPFQFSWGGCPMLLQDEVISVTILGTTYNSTYMGADFKYNGGLRSKVDATFIEDAFTTENNADTVSNAISRVQATVNNLDNTITLLAEQIPDNLTERLEKAEVQITPEEISAIVSSQTKVQLDTLKEDVDTLKEETRFLQTAEGFSAEVNKYVNNVKTSTGMTFDEEGISITKTGASTYTNIDEDGLRVKNTFSDENMLEVNSDGVTARQLNIEGSATIGMFKLKYNESTGKIGFYYLG